MEDERPWMNKIFSKKEQMEISDAAEQIIRDDDNGAMFTVTMSNNQCMDFVHHWHITRDDIPVLDAYESLAFIEDFLYSFMDFIEKHLEEEAPGWQERYYGIGEEN
jgi:hypothetical protein